MILVISRKAKITRTDATSYKEAFVKLRLCKYSIKERQIIIFKACASLTAMLPEKLGNWNIKFDRYLNLLSKFIFHQIIKGPVL